MRPQYLRLTLILSALSVLAGCASSVDGYSVEDQEKIAACEAKGGAARLHTGFFPGYQGCYSADDMAKMWDMEMACIQSGGNPVGEDFKQYSKPLPSGAGIMGYCARPQARQPVVFTQSSVPDIEVQSIEPYKAPEKSSWNCRSTTTNGQTNTYCN